LVSGGGEWWRVVWYELKEYTEIGQQIDLKKKKKTYL
jgi:hypothetical protein